MDLSQSLLQSDSSHLVPKKAKSKEPFLLRLINRVPSREFRWYLVYTWSPWDDDSERDAMKKVGMYYFPSCLCYEFDLPIELEAYYILLIEVMFKEKIFTYSKEQLRKDYFPTWNKKFLELYMFCTESELIKITFLATHPLVTINHATNEFLYTLTQNLMIIFAKNSPRVDIFASVAYNWKANPFLVEIQRVGYLEESIQPTIISLSTQKAIKFSFRSL